MIATLSVPPPNPAILCEPCSLIGSCKKTVGPDSPDDEDDETATLNFAPVYEHARRNSHSSAQESGCTTFLMWCACVSLCLLLGGGTLVGYTGNMRWLEAKMGGRALPVKQMAITDDDMLKLEKVNDIATEENCPCS